MRDLRNFVARRAHVCAESAGRTEDKSTALDLTLDESSAEDLGALQDLRDDVGMLDKETLAVEVAEEQEALWQSIVLFPYPSPSEKQLSKPSQVLKGCLKVKQSKNRAA